GNGAVSGWLLHLPRDRNPARGRPRGRRRCKSNAARIPRREMEGAASHPPRRSVAPGTPERLDLSGGSRRGARAGMSYDTVVVGAGLAGLTAALRLTQQGQRVLVVARGVGATHLSPATLDVLGYVGSARAESPANSASSLVAGMPDHPYAHVTEAQRRAAIAWFVTDAAAALWYVGSVDENLLLPTALGVPKPTAFAPRTMAGGGVSFA